MRKQNQKKEESPIPGSLEWEAVCQRCGRCCYEKFDYRGAIHYTKTACACLDLQTRQCRDYANRRQLQPGCAQLTPELIRSGVLPVSCPYQQLVAEEDDDGQL